MRRGPSSRSRPLTAMLDTLCTSFPLPPPSIPLAILSPMSFRSGSASFARFRVTGPVPQVLDDELLQGLAEHVVRPSEIGAPPPLQAGWCAGQHVFDNTFDVENILFGSTLVFGMRMDTNRVPAELRKAYKLMAEQAQRAVSATGLINRAERQVAREEAEERCRRELSEGRFRTSRLIPIAWDLQRRLVLAPAFADAAVTAMCDLFTSTTNGQLEPRTAGAIALEWLGARGRVRDYEDAVPTPYTEPPPGAEEDGATPLVPWSHAGPEPKDFLGNEFLLWLWWMIDTDGGEFDVDGRRVAVVIDRVLDTACAWDVTGTQALRADGPSRLAEAGRAIASGKWPRRAGLVVATDDAQWTLILQGDRFQVSGAKLPKPEELASAPPREQVEFRMASILDLEEVMVGLYEGFLDVRFGSKWSGTRSAIQRWIHRAAGPVKVGPMDVMVEQKRVAPEVAPAVEPIESTPEAAAESAPDVAPRADVEVAAREEAAAV